MEKELRSVPGFIRAEFDSGYRLRHFDWNWFEYQGPTLAHYTNLEGLLGIVQSGGFWLSDHRFLNDAEEFHNGRKLAQDVIERLWNKKRHLPFKKVLEQTHSLLEQTIEEPYFIASFSVDPDSLDQWRTYARGEQGISITFSNSTAPGYISHFIKLPIIHPSKVIYDDEVKIRILTRTIAKYSLEFREDIRRGDDRHEDIWSGHLARWLAVQFIGFKHYSFRSEQEVRIVTEEHFNGIKHRVTQGRIVPYINTSDLYNDDFYERLGTKLLPIREVCVGPTADPDVTVQSIRVFLQNEGYKNIQVKASEVPFRG